MFFSHFLSLYQLIIRTPLSSPSPKNKDSLELALAFPAGKKLRKIIRKNHKQRKIIEFFSGIASTSSNLGKTILILCLFESLFLFSM